MTTIRGLVVSIDPDCREPHKVLGAVRMIRGVDGVTAVMSIIQVDDPAALIPASTVPSLKAVTKAVCAHYGVAPEALLSDDRHKSIARARHVAMYLGKEWCGVSYPELGRAFGGRDHTTALAAVRKVKHLVTEDPRLNAELEAIERQFPQFDKVSA